MSRRSLGLVLLGVLAYATATIYLLPYAPALLPQTTHAPLSAAAVQTELAAVPAEAPLRLIVEPDDGTSTVTRSIEGAQKSVDLVIYELQDPFVEQALVDATRRGVAVRVLMQNLNSFGRHPNQPAYDLLHQAGVAVQWAPSYFKLTHQKTLLIDRARAYIMTFNLQPQYYASSRDFGVIDDAPQDVAAIAAAFDSDWSGQQQTAGTGADLVWSPGSAPTLLGLIAAASSTLDIYNEEMADQRITDALAAAAAHGVRVQVDMTYATNWKEPLNTLTKAGVHVRTYASSASFYIHAKVIIADRREAFVGSENFSAQSLDANRELGILIKRSDLIEQLEATFEEDWSGSRPYTVKQ